MGSTRLLAREMMFGWGDEFEYRTCESCGCMQIAEVPSNLSRYYPAGYYSFGPARDGAIRRRMKALRARALFGSRTPVGRLLLRRFGAPAALHAVARARVGRDDAILDVGCGAGHLLAYLHGAGFRSLTGCDPFLDRDTETELGVRLLKRDIGEMTGHFDFVMLHHSLEHVSDPVETMRHVARLLRPGGRALVRTPVAGSFASRTYGAEWVQLDAPRHLSVQSERSLGILARRVGLEIDEVVYDSSGFQFWGSEQYRRGLPLTGPSVPPGGPHEGQFTPAELRSFEARAAELNAGGDGDQACFYLSKATT